MMMNTDNYGDHLWKLRAEFGLSQVEAARRVGVHPTSWNRWERGRPMPELTYLGIRMKLSSEASASTN